VAGTSEEIPARRGILTHRRGIGWLSLIGLRGWRVYFPFKNRALAQDGINIEAAEFRVNQEGQNGGALASLLCRLMPLDSRRSLPPQSVGGGGNDRNDRNDRNTAGMAEKGRVKVMDDNCLVIRRVCARKLNCFVIVI
jgi:hypothetical protein